VAVRSIVRLRNPLVEGPPPQTHLVHSESERSIGHALPPKEAPHLRAVVYVQLKIVPPVHLIETLVQLDALAVAPVNDDEVAPAGPVCPMHRVVLQKVGVMIVRRKVVRVYFLRAWVCLPVHNHGLRGSPRGLGANPGVVVIPKLVAVAYKDLLPLGDRSCQLDADARSVPVPDYDAVGLEARASRVVDEAREGPVVREREDAIPDANGVLIVVVGSRVCHVLSQAIRNHRACRHALAGSLPGPRPSFAFFLSRRVILGLDVDEIGADKHAKTHARARPQLKKGPEGVVIIRHHRLVPDLFPEILPRKGQELFGIADPHRVHVGFRVFSCGAHGFEPSGPQEAPVPLLLVDGTNCVQILGGIES